MLEFIVLGGMELVDSLMQNALSENKCAKEGLEAIKVFLRYCDVYGITDRVQFDLSLARGLDYYTGIIYEAVLMG